MTRRWALTPRAVQSLRKSRATARYGGLVRQVVADQRSNKHDLKDPYQILRHLIRQTWSLYTSFQGESFIVILLHQRILLK